MAEDGNVRSAHLIGPTAEYVGDASYEDSQITKKAERGKLEKPYNRIEHLDWVRSITMYAFISIFALTVIASLVVVIWFGKEYPNLKDLLQPLLPAETGLIGSAVGFYFGSQVAKQGEGD
jgi:hypothetical protein